MGPESLVTSARSRERTPPSSPSVVSPQSTRTGAMAWAAMASPTCRSAAPPMTAMRAPSRASVSATAANRSGSQRLAVP